MQLERCVETLDGCLPKLPERGSEDAVIRRKPAGNGAPASPKAGRNADKNAEKSVGKTGTGFVISASGHILTNNHVIDGCTDIRGNLNGQPDATLRVVSSDAQNDLALLQGPAGQSVA